MDPVFGVLGHTALWIDGRCAESWGPRRERAVLAALLLHAGRPMPINSLVDWVWPEDAPTPRNHLPTLHTYATRIRRALLRTHASANLAGDHGTYRLDVDRSLIDYHLFRTLAADARMRLRNGHARDALELVARAISLWRGYPLADLHSDRAENWRQRVVADEWIPANTTAIEALLALGNFADALVRVDDLSAEYPHDLTLIKLRLAALHGLARYADVTATYFSARRRLLDDSDTQAADHLRRFHENLVADHAASTGPSDQPSSFVVPRQLPHDRADFVGRASLLARLDAAARTTSGDLQPGVVAIDGPAGVGKTALTVRWGHGARDLFPDGDLYVNLNGYAEDAPLANSTVVDDFLIALGHPPDNSVGHRSRELLLSRLLASRRTLVVLDNARDTAHVRDLVPLLSGSLVVVTSRQQLSKLSATTGARRVCVDPMPENEATMLLSARLGHQRHLPPGLRTKIIQLCGGLPLLVTVFAEHVAAWTDEQLAAFAAQLNSRQLISAVGISGDGATNAHAFFLWSYRALALPERRLFRLLGLHQGPDISADLASAYDGRTRPETTASLAALVGAHLLEQPDAFDRYRFHDLLREFAALCAETDEPEDIRRAAEHRALSYYLASAANADRLLYPSRMAPPPLPHPLTVQPTAFATEADAKTWFDRERTNLTATMRHAADHGYHDHVWRLVDIVTNVCDHYGYYTDSRDLREIAAASAASAGLREAEASTLVGLGMVHILLGDHAQARRCLDAALRYAEETGNQRGQASTLHQLGRLEIARGDPANAVTLYRQCLEFAQHTNDQEALCWTHCRMGEALRMLDQHEAALVHLHHAERYAQLIGEGGAHARSLAEIGAIHHDQGNHHAAAAHCHQALQIAEAMPDNAVVAHVCLALADINRTIGDGDTAIRYARRAVTVCQQSHNLIDEARAMETLGDTHFASGNTAEAVQAWRTARDINEQLGNVNRLPVIHGKIDKVPSRGPNLPTARTYQHPAPDNTPDPRNHPGSSTRPRR